MQTFKLVGNCPDDPSEVVEHRKKVSLDPLCRNFFQTFRSKNRKNSMKKNTSGVLALEKQGVRSVQERYFLGASILGKNVNNG